MSAADAAAVYAWSAGDEESHVLTPAGVRGPVESVIRASRKTNVTNHLADDERPWASHLTPADREKLTTYLAANPEKASTHLEAHLVGVGILTRPGPTAPGANLPADPPESGQP